ncbi:hypothetical protein DFH09DRAFT_1084575 [Mycena vulgaris]|nr:hypothetical protein DFH09DRAFT_1084575 [Mycena vulgaris]
MAPHIPTSDLVLEYDEWESKIYVMELEEHSGILGGLNLFWEVSGCRGANELEGTGPPDERKAKESADQETPLTITSGLELLHLAPTSVFRRSLPDVHVGLTLGGTCATLPKLSASLSRILESAHYSSVPLSQHHDDGGAKKKRRTRKATSTEIAENTSVHVGVDLDEIRHDSLTSEGCTTTYVYIPPEPAPVVMPAPAAPMPPPTAAEAKERPNATQMRTATPFLQKHILAHEANNPFGTPCACGEACEVVGPTCIQFDASCAHCVSRPRLCEVICHNCTQYRPSCKPCFVRSHRNNPFHWAEVWDADKGFLVRHNMAALGLGYALPFGHYGGDCLLGMRNPTPFTVADVTGVHATSVDFCCHGIAIDKMQQLLEARIIPCTFTDPNMGVTFESLKKFQMLNLEGKIAAYDYVASLARLSDNSFTESVPDMYENFLRCSRIWGVLTMKKRLGHEHGIDDVIPHRTKGCVVLHCPSCPEPAFNGDKKMGPLPKHLRLGRFWSYGNFHANKAAKNTDPTDVSLYDGQSYFPRHDFLAEQVAQAPKTEPASFPANLVNRFLHQKSTCNYLKAVNNLDKKKFKNMEITGIVSTQCSYVVVNASVDLQYGERYINVDISLAHAITQKLDSGHRGDAKFEIVIDLDNGVDEVLSYDAVCQYAVNIVKRWEDNPKLKHLAPIVKRMRFAIPALHVQGHQEGCIYAYSTAYMVATAHFHGETAEHYWPELNQLSPQTRQMNGGHRQGTIINHHGDWNYKKMAKSNELFGLHLNQFLGLSASYAERIVQENWRELDRIPDTKNMKNVISVYRYNKSKVPSQDAIYQKMLEDESLMPNSHIPNNKAAAFLREGIRIQESQVKLRVLVASNSEHPLVSTQRDIATQRTKLRNRVAKFRKDQSVLTPAVGDHLRSLSACQVEVELLGLPSEFPEVVRRAELGLVAMSEVEDRLREGAAFDSIHRVQIVAKALVAMRDRKKKNDSGVYKNISQKQINDTEERRDESIQRAGARLRVRAIPLTSGPAVAEIRGGATAMVKRKRAIRSPNKINTAARKPGKVKKKRDDGWIWTFGKMGKMGATELEEWTREVVSGGGGDAAGPGKREAALAEIRTTIRSFAGYKVAWAKLAELQDPANIGHIAYAKQKSWMFGRREELGRNALKMMPRYAELADDDADLVAFVEAERAIHDASLRNILDTEEIQRQIAADEAEQLETDEESDEESEGGWEDEDADDE